jgi:hypothetical protein
MYNLMSWKLVVIVIALMVGAESVTSIIVKAKYPSTVELCRDTVVIDTKGAAFSAHDTTSVRHRLCHDTLIAPR